jgi:hypothetical protein
VHPKVVRLRHLEGQMVIVARSPAHQNFKTI